MAKRTAEAISFNMSRIKSKDTKIELMLRKELWARGFRYRKNVRGIPGTPDIVFKKQKIAIFCDSEFWHGYNWESNKTRFTFECSVFWINKIQKNISRDNLINIQLEKEGWSVLRYWGFEIKRDISKILGEIAEEIFDRSTNAVVNNLEK